MIHASFESTIENVKPVFNKALKSGNIFEANNVAMKLSEILFRLDPEEARWQIWKNFYSRLKGTGVQYQWTDFEHVDYELYPVDGLKKLFRGPRPNMPETRDRYITFLGAAQFFGRHVQHPLHALVGDALGLTCVNLAAGGAGPKFFFSEEILKVANGGLAVILQVLSGRSIGCDEYPGGDLTFRKSGERVKRLRLLNETWETSRDEAVRLTRKWQQHYIETMTDLLTFIRVPVVLVWISARAPHEWSVDRFAETGTCGEFPQLIDDATIRRVSGKCAEFVELSSDEGLPYNFLSRFTGEKCPTFHKKGGVFWTNSYYPSAMAAKEVSTRIEAALRAMHISG